MWPLGLLLSLHSREEGFCTIYFIAYKLYYIENIKFFLLTLTIFQDCRLICITKVYSG
jgi:hypothetical protein